MKKLVIFLGVLFVSFSAVFVRFADASSMTLVFYRMGFAWLLLIPMVAVCCRGEFRSLSRRTLLLCMVSGVFLGLHFMAYFEGLRYTSIGSAVVLADTEVFFVAIAGILVLRERVPPLGWIGIGLTFAGSIVVALGDAGGGSDVLRGDLLALASAAVMAVYTMIGRVVRRTHTTIFYTFFVYAFAALTVLLCGAFLGQNVAACDGKNLLLCLGLAVVCTLLGHSVFSWGLKYESAAFVSTAKLLEPVLAALLGLLLFREVPGAGTVAGGAVIIAGIWWYSRHSEPLERMKSPCD